MNTTSTKLHDPVGGKGSLIRPIFSPGLLLQDDDLTNAVDYMRNMTRLLFRTMLGCGVMCGFKVVATMPCGNLKITVAKGLGLDCSGDLIELPTEQSIVIHSTCGAPLPAVVWVVISRHDKLCAPRDVMCSAPDGEVSSVCTRIYDGYQIQVLPAQPEGYCTCTQKAQATTSASPSCCDFIASRDEACYADHYHGKCACECNCPGIVLAKVTVDSAKPDKQIVDHSVRRYIRPVLMRDPLLPPPQAPSGGHPPGSATVGGDVIVAAVADVEAHDQGQEIN
jgi:hypothetical protein